MPPLNILVIDDERSIRDGCLLSLSNKGHKVDTCPNGRAGLEAIRLGAYDIVLLDLRLPDMDGMDILKTACRGKPALCIIVITGFSTVKGAVEAMKAGAFDYLAKPFSENDLLLTVNRARLNVFPIFIPALKERKDDIPRLAYYFLNLFCRKTGKRVEGFTAEALETLIRYDWPGNVRELKNVVERLVILAEGKTLENIYPLYPTRLRGGSKADRVPETAGELRDFKRHLMEETYEMVEKTFLLKALEDCQGNITQAAQMVGMQRPYFHSLLKKYGLKAKGPKMSR